MTDFQIAFKQPDHYFIMPQNDKAYNFIKFNLNPEGLLWEDKCFYIKRSKYKSLLKNIEDSGFSMVKP